MNNVFKFEMEVPKTLMIRRAELLKTMLEQFLQHGHNVFSPSSVLLRDWRKKYKDCSNVEISGDFAVLEGLGYLKRTIGVINYELTKKAYRLLETKEILKL